MKAYTLYIVAFSPVLYSKYKSLWCLNSWRHDEKMLYVERYCHPVDGEAQHLLQMYSIVVEEQL